jgi:hypothetical protein
VRDVWFQDAVEPWMKPLPVIVIVRVVAPAVAVEGEIEPIAGDGFD